jgi:hypothetical protein
LETIVQNERFDPTTGRNRPMKLKMLSIAALALSLAGGAAIAQTSEPGNGGSDAAPQMFEDPKTMEPFFTDSSMATMRSEEEVKAAFNRLPDAQQEEMKSQCAITTSEKYRAFCATIGAL